MPDVYKCDKETTDSAEAVKVLEQLTFRGTRTKRFLRLFSSLFNTRMNAGYRTQGLNSWV
jgi:hypothetical protein